jgi:hypothetical protein
MRHTMMKPEAACLAFVALSFALITFTNGQNTGSLALSRAALRDVMPRSGRNLLSLVSTLRSHTIVCIDARQHIMSSEH